jgi:glutamate-5-semialdehyde dehydrogenase
MATDLAAYCLDVAQRARAASRLLVRLDSAAKNAWLRQSASLLRRRTADVIAANANDLAAAPGFGLSDAATDRLRLDAQGVAAIASALEEIAEQPDPVGEVIESSVRPNGLEVRKVRVPLGVVFFIYESRPNVTADAAALCVKSGNAVILRGGKEAAHSSRAIADVLAEAARDCAIPEDAVQLVSTPDREAVGHFLALSQYIDLAIPRGGEGLIRRVTAEARMPVLKHFDGNCHVYVDRAADLDVAIRVLVNAKCQRLGTCNTAESLVVHADIARTFLPKAAAALGEHDIEIRGDERTRRLVPAATPATEEDYRREYLGPIISCKVVDSIDEAIAHINRYGSQHTDAIVSTDAAAAAKFAQEVDTAAVMINASTRFNDGGELGLGAEIGISTDKFHARGPCGARELTTYKWIVSGNGQVRE